MRLPAPVRAVGWRTGKRAVDWSAKHLKLASYVPMFDYREQLDANTTLTRDARPIRDKRAVHRLRRGRRPDAHARRARGRGRRTRLGGRRMLEVGPKYGIHTRWIDEHLSPSSSRSRTSRRIAASARAVGGGPLGAARVGVRRPSPRARTSARTAPSTSSSSSASSTTAPSTSSCSAMLNRAHAPRRRDAARDDDRPATRLRRPRPLAARDGQGEDGADLRRAPDRARLDRLARRDRLHGLPAGVRRGAASLPQDRRAREDADVAEVVRPQRGPAAA